MANTQLKKPSNIWIQKEYLLEFKMLNTLENLIKLARDRKSSPVEGSYTNKLLSDKSLSKAKVLEEVDELIEAVEENTNKIHEAADVFYHLLMYLEANDIKIEDVMSELEKRKK
jgi:phosphoribosyl-ATP pyrophosphohydrolase